MMLAAACRMTAFVACLAAFPALAQNQDFTTAEGAAFVHQSLGDAMLSFQNEGDIDFIYFSGILAWRCGTTAIQYGLNDDPPETVFPAEPCYREFREPNVLQHIGEADYPFFLKVPKESVQKVTIRVVYENGKTADFTSERAKNLIP